MVFFYIAANLAQPYIGLKHLLVKEIGPFSRNEW
jgi:hypothetical protein